MRFVYRILQKGEVPIVGRRDTQNNATNENLCVNPRYPTNGWKS